MAWVIMRQNMRLCEAMPVETLTYELLQQALDVSNFLNFPSRLNAEDCRYFVCQESETHLHGKPCSLSPSPAP